MNWIQTTVYTEPQALEIVNGLLDSLGIDQVEVFESSEMIRQFLEETRLDWDLVEASLLQNENGRTGIRFYLCDNEDGRKQLSEIQKAVYDLAGQDLGIDIGVPEILTEVIEDEDWNSNWKKYYHSFNVGSRLWIRPLWEQGEPPEGRAMVVIEPGMAFGTGSHETTELCMTLLCDAVSDGDNVIDVGCGTGILGIAALKLGAGHVTAIDRDVNCITATRNNAAYNQVEEGKDITIILGNLLEPVGFQADLIVANIFAEVIALMVDDAFRLTKPNGLFIASGIICEKEAMITEKLEKAGFVIEKVLRKADWVGILSRKPENA